MHIDLHCPCFFKTDGSELASGGHERYTRDLSRLLLNMGLKVTIHQIGLSSWSRNYEGMEIQSYERSEDVTKRMGDNSGDRIIYTWLGQQVEQKPNNISICHGIWWDNPAWTREDILEGEVKLIEALQYSTCIVSVDTNFLGYVRATSPNMSKKIVYIPNYVDQEIFFDSPEISNTKGDLIDILYPRRLDPVRGFDLLISIGDDLLNNYPNIRLTFALDYIPNKAFKNFNHWFRRNKHRDRIRLGNPDYETIAPFYRESDIVVLPTMSSEGTSFSGLEAMACGKPVVTTNVGGLNNLFINGYNALVTSPDKVEVYQALSKLIESKDLRDRLGSNSLAMADCFSKEIWETRWRELITKFYL